MKLLNSLILWHTIIQIKTNICNLITFVVALNKIMKYEELFKLPLTNTIFHFMLVLNSSQTTHQLKTLMCYLQYLKHFL